MDRFFIIFSCFVCVLLLFGNTNSAVIQRTEETVTIISLDSDTVALPSTTEPLFDCKSKKDGTYPDYHRACRVFFLCQAENLRVFWCLNGTVFNPESGHCDLPSKVRCVNPDRRGWLPLAGECLDLEDGVYVDYSSGCRNFYFCSGGLKTSFTCPDKTLFDWQTGYCRPSQHVSCGLLSCESKENGFHVDYRSGCKRYYLCDDRRKTEFVCPQGTVFNTRLSRCTDPKGVRCRGDEAFNCNGLPDGYYPDHHSGCRTFYYCHNGKSKSYSCPSNMAFNRNTLACDQAWKTHCERAFTSSSDCSSRPDGVYAKYETNCREFMACRRGLVHQTGVCPPGKLFSPVTGLCQPSSLVICASVKDPDCDSRNDGMYPDAGTGCAAFYVCLNGRRVLTSYCATKTLYDVATGTCLPSPLVTCNATSTAASLVTKMDSYDCRGRVGLYPDFDVNCKSYFVCAFGHKVRVDCPLGTGFNPESKRCETRPGECKVPKTLGAFRCLSGDEGIYPTSNCKRWHECWDKVGYTYECSEGLTFDLRVKACLPSSKTICDVDGYQNHLSNGTSFRDTDFSCDGRVNGVYPSTQPGDCQTFHICAEGKSFSSKCPDDFIFDLENWHCLPTSSGKTCPDEVASWSNAYDDQFTCQSDSNGMYPDVTSKCTRYFVCENGRKTVVYCPDGERFDKSSMVCEDAALVRCGLDTIEVTTLQPQSTYATRVDRNDVNDKLTDNNGSPNSLSASFGCPSDESGFFPDFTSNCRNFHVCFNGVRRTYSCPSLLLFNPATKICDLPLNVDCVPRIKPIYNCTSENGEEVRQGLYPDYSSGCSRYYACSEEGNAIVYTCTPGKMFDFRTQTCEVAEKVVCEEGNVSGSLYHAHGVPKRFVFHCLDKEDGFYPDYARHCHVFYRCIKGKKVSHYCKPGLLFNPEVGICDFEENVTCAAPA